MANIKISELIVKDSPSTSATLVGVDNGETVQVPITEFAESEHEHNGYAKTSDIPSLDGYAKTTDIPSLDGYAKTSDIPSLDGYAKTSDLFSKNYNDLTNKPTIPSIAGLATEKYVDDKISSLPSGGGSGGGASIIYATEKPSTPQQAIYVITEDEVVKAEVYSEGVNITPDEGYCEIVDELPENPIVALDLTTGFFYVYYCTKDNEGWVYFDETVSTALEMPAGWLPVSAMGAPVSTSVDDMPESGQGLLLTKQPKTRVYVPMQDGTFLELTSGVRTRFDEYSGNVSITEV